MHVLHTVASVRAWTASRREAGERIGLVPTMGALHEGHLSLVDTARGHADAVLVTVFVNPKQFAPGEDLDSYPRTLGADVAMCAERGAAAVFAPNAREMYPGGFQTAVEVSELGLGRLCAVSRPHFFGGVATVVLKLLNIAMADVAVFGDKDYQQLQVIKRMCRDLDHPTAIVGSPLVREESGLAMSSRNRYLSDEERAAAAGISAALFAMADAVAAGQRDVRLLTARAHEAVTAAGGAVDYVSIVDAADLEPIASVQTAARGLMAATFGGARLIDNGALGPPC